MSNTKDGKEPLTGEDKSKTGKKMTASSVMKEFGLSVEELYDILNELYNELEKRNEGDEGTHEEDDEAEEA